MKRVYIKTTENSSVVNTIIVVISIFTITAAISFVFHNQKGDEIPAEISGQGPHKEPYEEPLQGPHKEPYEEPHQGPHQEPLQGPHQEPLQGPHREPYQDPIETVETKEAILNRTHGISHMKKVYAALYWLSKANFFYKYGKSFYPSNASTAVQMTSPATNYKTEYEAVRTMGGPYSKFSEKTPAETFLEDYASGVRDTKELSRRPQTLSQRRFLRGTLKTIK